MTKRYRIRDLGIKIGDMETGKYNAITDVKGVRVGHITLIKGKAVRTGVTAILPHPKNIYLHKVKAIANVINGFGKSVGIPQIQELGEIETPILLTNTLNTWKVADALVDYMIKTTEEEITSINPVVLECNDSYLNDIRGKHVEKEHVEKAIVSAKGGPVEEGSVGAGTGMSAFEMKGGIGTASRIIPYREREYVLGTLVLSNFGKMEQLRINGIQVGKELKDKIETNPSPDGSIIVILATSASLSYRQLGRILNRVPHALARVGSISSNYSGDFAIGFVGKENLSSNVNPPSIQEESLSLFFQGTIEAIEEAILNSLFQATTITGKNGYRRETIPIETVCKILDKYLS